MGGGISQFQQQFRQRYSFIQHIQDPFFGLVKVYRKNTFRYDYIMVLEIGVNLIRQQKIQQVQQRLQMIRNHLNESTLRVYFYKVVRASKTQCRQNHLLVYAEYLNRNLRQYLAALRTNPHFVLTVSELIYVIKNVCKGCLAMKKMGIHTVDLNINKIFISTDGQALVCPLLYILESFKAYGNQEDIPNLKSCYKKYSVSRLRNTSENFPLKNQFMGLFLQLSGHIDTKKMHQINNIHQIISQSISLQQLYRNLPETVQNLEIEQMYRQQNIQSELYNIN